MALSDLATETLATALIAEGRRCLRLGVDMKATYIQQMIWQLELATTSSLTSRVDVSPDYILDGENDGQLATAGS